MPLNKDTKPILSLIFIFFLDFSIFLPSVRYMLSYSYVLSLSLSLSLSLIHLLFGSFLTLSNQSPPNFPGECLRILNKGNVFFWDHPLSNIMHPSALHDFHEA